MAPTAHTLWRALVLAGLTAISAGTAMAQWQWIDGSGRRVFSDTPPPAGTPDKHILKRPVGARAALASAVTASAATAASATATTTAAPSGKDSELEARKKQAEQAEQAKKKAELDKLNQARAENCERAKRAKATLDSGIRIATTNAKGEREIMDDKGRASEAQRLDGVIRSDCGPLPAAAVQ